MSEVIEVVKNLTRLTIKAITKATKVKLNAQ
jgi:hypothetical protein